MKIPSLSGETQAPIATVLPVREAAARDTDPLARFYSEHPPLAGEVPHHNPRNGAILHALKVTCDDCNSVLPLEALHGVINDYPYCTEIRYVGSCPECHRAAHNVLRLTGDEMRFMQDGKWCVATRRPWWHRLWPWPVSQEWS